MKQITYSETVKNLRGLLKEYIVKSNLKSLVLGISGGIDSALVAALAKPVVDELGIPLIGRSISIQTNKEDEEERARNIGKYFCTDFKEVNLTEQYLVLREFDDMEGEGDDDIAYKIRMGNIKARMRMTYLYNLASKNNGLVLSTDNMTELLLGFWTLHGDVGDYGLIQEMWKTEVYGMTEWLALNSETIAEKESLMATVTGNATDGLGISSTDLDQILPDWKDRHTDTRGGYEEVDNILIDYLEMVDKLIWKKTSSLQEQMDLSNKVRTLSEHPVIVRHMRSQFKRENPYNEKREKYIVY
jgi:NAD+ synthase